MKALALFFACALVGCGERVMSAKDAGSERGERASETQVDTSSGATTSYAPSIHLGSPLEEGRTQRIGADLSPAAPARPSTHGKIDVDLKAAQLGDALRFIADAGGFNLVVQGEPASAVTVKLRQVDAYDALLTVAEAQGLEVRFERGIVVVGAVKAAPYRGLARDEIQ
jgi:hypothetical protein